MKKKKTKKALVVLSVFDGMGCGQIALKEMGIPIKKYYSAEIDKFANEQTRHNFPHTIQLGSVTEVRAKDLDRIDLFIGGSPCQGFSFAGKQLNFNDPRSKLFFEYTRLWNEIKEINPKAKFLLENVNMRKEYLRVISQYLSIYPVRINSNRVSAQNRDRWYWTNIKTEEVGIFRDLTSGIPQPPDQGILLKDILQDESEIDAKYYLSEKALKNFHDNNLIMETSVRISGTTKTPTAKGTNSRHWVYETNGKIGCVSATCYKQPQQIIVRTPREARSKEAKEERRRTGKNKFKAKNIELTKEQTIFISEPTIKGFAEIQPGQCFDAQHPKSKTRRGRKMAKKTNCLLTANEFIRYTHDYKLRRLTPTECARLQNIPDWYEWIVSDTQIYKMLGNGWTVGVIKHIFSYL